MVKKRKTRRLPPSMRKLGLKAARPPINKNLDVGALPPGSFGFQRAYWDYKERPGIAMIRFDLQEKGAPIMERDSLPRVVARFGVADRGPHPEGGRIVEVFYPEVKTDGISKKDPRIPALLDWAGDVIIFASIGARR